MNKLTKIVATIGPACDSPEMIKKLILAGVDTFRFNFKHNTVEWHNGRIARVNEIAQKLGRPIATLIDLQGPEIRINMPTEELSIENGELILFGEEAFKTHEKGLSISHPQVINHLKDGQRLVADNGALIFHFKKVGSQTYIQSLSSGILKNRKSINIPGADFPFPVLVDRDFEGLKLVQRKAVDFVALSFVRSAEDIKVVRSEMKKYKLEAKVIAKIETKKALNNLEEIINVSDGIMVARGDLGVELPIEEVPYYQKIIIKETIKRSLPVITATQMLESMIEKPYPTRAEVSDIANANYDLTDAVMLSAETAIGSYPLQAVQIMAKTVAFNEKQNKVDSRARFNFNIDNTEEALADSAYGLYMKYKELNKKIAGFLIFTNTGNSVRLIARYRPLIPIFSFATNYNITHQLSLRFGCIPFCLRTINKNAAIKILLQKELIAKGQSLIVIQDGVTNISLWKI